MQEMNKFQFHLMLNKGLYTWMKQRLQGSVCVDWLRSCVYFASICLHVQEASMNMQTTEQTKKCVYIFNYIAHGTCTESGLC